MGITDVIARQAEETARIDAELAQARPGGGYQDPTSAAELREQMKASGAEVGGLVSSGAPMRIYNRYDGSHSDITTDQARQRLSVRFDRSHIWAGQLVWTTKPPDPAPAPGTLKCPLHPESEERGYLDGLHFGGMFCRKHNMRTEKDRNDHFKGKHKSVHLAVEQDKDRELKRQQMDLMREQTAAMQAMAAAQTGTRAASERDTPTIEASETLGPAVGATGHTLRTCHSCGEEIVGKLADHECKTT